MKSLAQLIIFFSSTNSAPRFHFSQIFLFCIECKNGAADSTHRALCLLRTQHTFQLHRQLRNRCRAHEWWCGVLEKEKCTYEKQFKSDGRGQRPFFLCRDVRSRLSLIFANSIRCLKCMRNDCVAGRKNHRRIHRAKIRRVFFFLSLVESITPMCVCVVCSVCE